MKLDDISITLNQTDICAIISGQYTDAIGLLSRYNKAVQIMRDGGIIMVHPYTLTINGIPKTLRHKISSTIPYGHVVFIQQTQQKAEVVQWP